jgi:serine/threonine-protein kinase
MAEIFLARQAGPAGFEKLVVVKKILDNYVEDPEFVAMFLDEARIAALLNHPNIVQVFDLGEDKGSYYIAMEYLAGESLATVARSAQQFLKPVSLAMAARLISQAAEALDYAHRRNDSTGKPLGIVHRDVSPQNLFVTYDGSLKVVDFGIAKASNKVSHTQDGQVKGKISYMSPEQAQGLAVDARADVFALGVVLFELCTESRLLSFENPVQTFKAILGPEPLPLPTQRNPAIPLDLEAIIMKALARDRDQRYASADALHLALEDWLRSTGGITSGVIASYMQSLFEQRIGERALLVERASRGEEILTTPPHVRREDTDRSMPGATNNLTRTGATRAPPSSQPSSELPSEFSSSRLQPLWKTKPALGGGAALALLAIVVTVISMHKSTPSDTTPTLPTAPTASTATSAALPTRLTVSTEPPGSWVRIDGSERGKAPVTLEDLTIGDHIVVAHLEGRPELSRTVTLKRPGESLEVVLPLPPPVAAVDAKAPTGATAPTGTTATTAAVAVAAAKRGKLTINTVPWTQVYEGTHELGITPIIEKSMTVGTHRLRLENADKHISQLIEVEVTANQVTTKNLRF